MKKYSTEMIVGFLLLALFAIGIIMLQKHANAILNSSISTPRPIELRIEDTVYLQPNQKLVTVGFRSTCDFYMLTKEMTISDFPEKYTLTIRSDVNSKDGFKYIIIESKTSR